MCEITIDQLEDCLQRVFEDPPGIDEIQAIFATVAIGPELIKSNDWMGFIFERAGGLPELKTKTKDEEFMESIIGFYNETVQSIHEDRFEPIFTMSKDSNHQKKEMIFPESWCFAFHDAMYLHGEGWINEEDEELFAILMPILFFIDQEFFKKTLKIKSKKKMEELRGIMLEGIPEAVMEIRDYFQEHKPAGKGRILSFEQQNTPSVVRNDPCPCGSGKKYKFCCGNPG
ncbi:UPF0149 family protein [bacterium]|nr:UPF0149 family protein [bacterium]